jgi:hypothetical protein
MSTARGGIGGLGTQTLALGFGGYNPGSYYANTEEWTGDIGTANSKTLTTS